MRENLQRKHEAQLNEAYDQIKQTITEFNTQHNQRNETNAQNRRKTERTEISDNRQQRSENTEIQNNSITEPPLPFYEQLTSMSINEEPQIETSSSNGSVPTIKPFDGTDPGYTVEQYLNSIIAALIFRYQQSKHNKQNKQLHQHIHKTCTKIHSLHT